MTTLAPPVFDSVPIPREETPNLAPSSISDFDKNKWFYIERLKTNQSLVKLGTQRIKKNNILVVQLSSSGILKNKKLLNFMIAHLLFGHGILQMNSESRMKLVYVTCKIQVVTLIASVRPQNF